MTQVLCVLGAIASIIGAFYAWRQAGKAKSYAERAEVQIASKRRISDFARLKVRWEDTYEALAVFGSGAMDYGLRGKSPAVAARKVQDYIEAVTRCKASLQTIQDLDKRLESLSSLLDEFSSARVINDLKEKGTRLLTKLSDLNAAIQGLHVLEREAINLT